MNSTQNLHVVPFPEALKDNPNLDFDKMSHNNVGIATLFLNCTRPNVRHNRLQNPKEAFESALGETARHIIKPKNDPGIHIHTFEGDDTQRWAIFSDGSAALMLTRKHKSEVFAHPLFLKNKDTESLKNLGHTITQGMFSNSPQWTWDTRSPMWWAYETDVTLTDVSRRQTLVNETNGQNVINGFLTMLLALQPNISKAQDACALLLPALPGPWEQEKRFVVQITMGCDQEHREKDVEIKASELASITNITAQDIDVLWSKSFYGHPSHWGPQSISKTIINSASTRMPTILWSIRPNDEDHKLPGNLHFDNVKRHMTLHNIMMVKKQMMHWKHKWSKWTLAA